MVLVLLSCGREPTTAPHDAPARFARGLSFNAIFPQSANMAGIADLIEFNRVRVVLRRTDGSVALDTTITFPPGAEALTVSFDIRLSPGTPPSGELLMLDLAYLNPQGDTVWRGGPVEVLAIPALAGQPPPAPVSVNLVYTGPGAAAKTVRISQRTLSVNTGASFAFTADGLDASGAVVANAPIGWSSLDPTRATVTLLTAGNGNALGQRGTARIVAQLINGAADTVTLTINAVPTTIAAVSGTGQTGIVGKPTPRTLAQPLVVRVTAADGLGVAGVSVAFLAANGGSVNPATATTDSSGKAQTTWTLGPTALSQTATAAVAGLGGSPVTFTATGQLLPATKLALTTAPTAGSSIPSGTPIGLVVTAQDVDGDPASSFTGTVTVALSVNPAGGTLAGTTSASAAGGVASFPNLSIAKPGTGYVLQATSGSLASVSTPAFDIVTGAPSNLALFGGGNYNVAAGSTLSPITALVTDANGNPKAGVTVNFAVTVTSDGGSVAPTSAVTDTGGKASATWTLGSTIGTQTLGISSTGLTTLAVTAMAFSTVQTWLITTQPGATQVAGLALTPAIVARLRDASNALVTSFNGPVTMAIGTNPGGATIGGTTTVTASGGVATFSNANLNKLGTGYTLVVSSSGATSVTSNVFNVTAASAAAIAVAAGNDQTATAGSAVATSPAVKVQDANGNAVSGVTVTFAAASGSGSLTGATPTTGTDGIATVGLWTLSTTAGTNTLTATATGLTGSPLTFTATGAASALASIAVTPTPTTLAIGGTQQFAAVGKDANGNVVAITPTWAVVASGGTIDTTTGLFTAGTVPGTFLNTVKATSGTLSGTADVVVKAGPLATITVTPNPDTLAINGTQQFTAVGKDASGNVVAITPVWSAVSGGTIISGTGLFTAGLTTGTFTNTVKATSGTISGMATVTVQ